jgi:hypothetical protein
MSDARFDSRSVFHPLPERLWRFASLTFVHVDTGIAHIVVAAIAHAHMHFANPIIDQRLDLFQRQR